MVLLRPTERIRRDADKALEGSQCGWFGCLIFVVGIVASLLLNINDNGNTLGHLIGFGLAWLALTVAMTVRWLRLRQHLKKVEW